MKAISPNQRQQKKAEGKHRRGAEKQPNLLPLHPISKTLNQNMENKLKYVVLTHFLNARV